jgi:signal transduction histidine kinase
MRLRRWFAPLWLVVAACAVVNLLLHVPLLQDDLFYTTLHEAAAQLAMTVSGREAIGLGLAVLSLGCAAVFAGAGALIFWRRRGDPMALLTSLALLTAPAMLYFGGLDDPHRWYITYGGEWGERLVAFNNLLRALGYVLFFSLLYLFPDGHPGPRWAKAGFSIGLAGIALITLSSGAWGQRLLSALTEDAWVFFVVALILSITVGAARQTWGYRRAGTLLERQQVRWVAVAFALFALSFLFSAALGFINLGPVANLIALVDLLARNLSALFIPLALVAAVARYRLWDAEPLMRRAVVYAVVTAFVVGAYALIVGGVGALTGAPGASPLLALIATGAVAVAFSPVRDALQRLANRALFGQRDEPHTVVAQHGQRLAQALAPEDALQLTAQTIGQALKLPLVEIELAGKRYRFGAGDAAPDVADMRTFALTYQDESLGVLRVASRQGERLSDKDARLLEDLARQAGVAVRAALATAELRRSREQIVTAREEERRRLRRDLHDGVGPTLASLYQRIDAAGALLARDPAAAAQLLADTRAQMKDAIASVRQMVYSLRPPALDELGLVDAVREECLRLRLGSGVPALDVQAAGALPSLSAAVDVAAYRIAIEAVSNVLKHAGATRCGVTFTAIIAEEGGRLLLEVIDDGAGLPVPARSGVGLQAMRERAEELGGFVVLEAVPSGGTRVRAELPLQVEHEHSRGGA